MKAAGANKRSAKRDELDYVGSEANYSAGTSQPNASEAVKTQADTSREAVPQVARPQALAARAVRTRNPVDLSPYRAIVVGGHIQWSPQWVQRLTAYVTSGGTVVLNSAQIKGLPADLLGLRLTGETGEAHNARCLSPAEAAQDLKGQIFRYDKVELKGAQPLITTISAEPLITINKVGKGSLIFSTVPDLLGEDERLTPFAAHMLAHVFSDATPIKVSGNVEYLINQTEAGWIITLFNNEGVVKPQQGLAQVDRRAVATASISWGGAAVSRAQEWISDSDLKIAKQTGKPDSVTVNIPPGAIAIVELK